MAIFRSFAVVGVALLAAQNGEVSATFLAPAQDIVLPSSDSATSPLEHLGANSPYFAGPNVNGVSNDVPEGCVVEQVAYVSRHGSRYPDQGAYNQWTALYAKIQNASFTAKGSMEFLHTWKPVLTNPALQIAQESTTGYKEAYDMGYALRTRYPDLYQYGQTFMAWSNLYPRVVQTAQNFVRGFLGNTATALGTVITVNATGSVNALFDSLGPSDQCPLYVDGNGGTPATTWNAIYLPPILARLQGLIVGDLTFTTTDVSIMPYLCGFESQITGQLSPWCSVFTDAELVNYEYAQDLRYYYGSGPGTDLPSKMMLPFANGLVSLLAQGPGTKGIFANGSTYQVPNIITAFTNDGQMTQLNSAIGVWDNTTSLGDGTAVPAGYKYRASHFVTMRGTVAFERLNCKIATPVKRAVQDEASFVTETKKKTVTVTICPTETPVFATSIAALPVSSIKTAGGVISEPAYTMSTILSTHTYTITSCAATVTDCPVGKITKTVYTSTTWCPVATEGQATATATPVASQTSTAAAKFTTSTILSTSTYTITSCAPTVTNCPIGKVTETVYTSTTVCPVSEGETGSPSSGPGASSGGSASASATSGSGSAPGSGSSGSSPSATAGTGSTSGTASSGSSPTNSGASATATSTSIGSGSGIGSNSTISSSVLPASSYYPNATSTISPQSNSSVTSTSTTAVSTPTSGTTDHTYIRILLNDAVYPLPSCQNGPGKSCLLSEYAAFMAARLAAAGNLPSRCNVTAKGAPTTVKGASFFTDLSQSWLGSVAP